jgi:hypothetical protein
MNTYTFKRWRRSVRAEARMVDAIWADVEHEGNTESGRIEFDWARRGVIWVVTARRYQPLDFTAPKKVTV